MKLNAITPISITEKALTEINKALSIKGIPEGYFLRVGLKGSACSASYIIGFDKKEDNDETYQLHNIDLIINKHHLMYLLGVELDFDEEGNGFTFNK
ncbi:MAG: HesB/IscA family protein [Spirosomataceae bacterium]|jgi:iron-sulfur cluster assembly protein|nr:iron-sulfur cluster assembly accessory protein [Flectobacillus sp.]